jgi:hypothetical protein
MLGESPPPQSVLQGDDTLPPFSRGSLFDNMSWDLAGLPGSVGRDVDPQAASWLSPLQPPPPPQQQQQQAVAVATDAPLHSEMEAQEDEAPELELQALEQGFARLSYEPPGKGSSGGGAGQKHS